MKALVTGGAGFIGSNLVDKLIGMGIQVAVVDDLSSGYERNLNPAATFYKLNILENSLTEVFEQEKPQVVYHLAAQTVVTKSVKDPAFDARTNILGSINVIDNCVKSGVKKLVYASSCAAYGKPEYLPVDEQHPIKPLSQYGASKHTVEHYLEIQNSLSGLPYIAFRFGNVYGPRQNPYGEGGVIAIFSNKMLSNERPAIYGCGDKTRDYIYVGDIVNACILTLESPINGIFNLGTGQETLDQTVFDRLKQACGYKGQPIYANERPGEIKRMNLSFAKAKNELEWHPEINLDEGIAMTVEYYRSRV